MIPAAGKFSPRHVFSDQDLLSAAMQAQCPENETGIAREESPAREPLPRSCPLIGVPGGRLTTGYVTGEDMRLSGCTNLV